eukprot:TRINITY_DN69322_c0_g1_i1.p1 TRINITY_DN69322_c0_g1~~TRINITY_DN69322_c0_g1_i1.p1  ORF type:complete len:333 (+),score=27.35 TRINITY_DN69322_c0_g1_i1:29-1027(+)
MAMEHVQTLNQAFSTFINSLDTIKSTVEKEWDAFKEQQHNTIPAQSQPAMTNNTKMINLNVGGQRFSTSWETLMSEQDSYFWCLAKNQAWLPSKNEEHFIDRSPVVFDVILDFLRTRQNPVGLSTLSERERTVLRSDVDFYQIHSLQQLLHPSTASPVVPKSNFDIFWKENGEPCVTLDPSPKQSDFRWSTYATLPTDTRRMSWKVTARGVMLAGYDLAVGMAPRCGLPTEYVLASFVTGTIFLGSEEVNNGSSGLHPIKHHGLPWAADMRGTEGVVERTMEFTLDRDLCTLLVVVGDQRLPLAIKNSWDVTFRARLAKPRHSISITIERLS